MSESALPGESGFSLPWPAGRSEERLARRAAAGDERAFAAIFRRYGPELHRYCLAIVGNGADAQDALQNTMVKALRSLPGERREIKLKPWLYRVAHNESVELLRQRRSEELDPETAAPGAGLAETAAQRQRLRHLLADLEQLPERQRGALLMRELSGLDFEQVGAALGISAPAARQTVYEARLGLREMEAGREMSCDLVTKAISDGDGRVLRRRDVRAHLRSCADCRAFRAGIANRRHDLAALSPLPAAALAALLKSALGSSASGTVATSAGAGAAAGTGGGTGAAIGAGAAGGGLVKAAATVAVVAVVGAGAADRAGLVHIGGGDGGKPAAQRAADGAAPAAASGRGAASGARLTRAERVAQRKGRLGTLPGVAPAAAVPRPAAQAASPLPGKDQAGGREGGEAAAGGPSARKHGTGPQEGGGRQGKGPPAHSHAGGNSAGGRAHAGGNSTNSHAKSDHGSQSGAEPKAAHSPGNSQSRGAKNGNRSTAGKGKSAPHAAAPPSSPPRQPAQPKAAQAEAPAGGAEADRVPEASKERGASEAKSESSS